MTRKYYMFLEIYYKNLALTTGNALARNDFVKLIPKSYFQKKIIINNIFEQRPAPLDDTNLWTDVYVWSTFKWLFFYKYRSNYEYLNTQQTANIVFKDLIAAYKAWRHYRGYPVNGQRTWSNGKSCSKNNTILKNYRLKQFLTEFGAAKKTNYATLIQAEAMNKLWLKTWPFEWIEGRYHAMKSKSRKGTSIPIDVVNLAKGITTGYLRFGRGERWNSSKKALKTVTVGLPIYFSRYFFGEIKKKHFKFQLTLLQPETKAIKQKKKKTKLKKSNSKK